MRRALVAASLAPLLLLAARATADDFKWDPRHQHAPPRVGQKSTTDVVEYRKFATKIAQGGKTHDTTEEATTTYKMTSEIVAVDGRKISEALVKIDAWKLEKKGEDPDTSLEGHTVRVKGTGDARTATIEDDKDDKVSDQGKKWVEAELAKKIKKKADGTKDDDEEQEMACFMPRGPVGEGATWKPEIEAVSKEIGLPCDAAKSTLSGTLAKVRLENGVHMGHIDVKGTLWTVPPGVTWHDGGKMEVTISRDLSLDADAPETSESVLEVKFSGDGEAAGEQGPLTLKQSIEQKRTARRVPVK